jgi:hypothetical protein
LAFVHGVHQLAATAPEVTNQFVPLPGFHETRRTFNGETFAARLRQTRAKIVQSFVHLALPLLCKSIISPCAFSRKWL